MAISDKKNIRLKEINILNLFEQIQENTLLGLAMAFIPNPEWKLLSESEYFTGDTSLDIHSPGPTIAKTSL